MMKGKDFLDSKWCKDAASPEKQAAIKDGFARWSTRVNNTGLLGRAKQLFQFFLSPEISGTKKVVVAGALLYIISPLDIIPDFIPVLGWFDDIGVAGFALNYIFSQMDQVEANKINDGQYLKSCSPEELLEGEIWGTGDDCKWNLKSSDIRPEENKNYQSEKIKSKIVELAEIAKVLAVDDADHFLSRIETKLEENRIMNVAIVGRYSSGKSTLINALLGKNILPSSPIPTTKAVTYVMKGNMEALYSENGDGEIIIHNSLNNLKAQYDRSISTAQKIAVTLPDFPFDNLSFTDTPGLEENDQSIVQLTLEALPDADAIIIVMDANYLQSKAEFQFISSLLKNDRERKLFIVINKVDGKSSEQINELEKMCHSLLIEYGVTCAGVYPLSAKDAATDTRFVKFKKSLFEFLENSIQREVLNHLNNELSSYAVLLQESCENRLELAAQSEHARHIAVAENKKHFDTISGEYEKQKRLVLSKLKQYQAQFFLDFSNFIDSLKVTAQQEINASSLEKLKNSEQLALRIKQEIISFVDSHLETINEKLSTDIFDSQAKIKTHLAQMQIQLNGDTKDYSPYARLFMPTVVLVSFLSCGFLTFIWTVIAAMIGQNFFESAISSFLSSVGVKGTKEKLTEQVFSNINKIKQELTAQLETSFVNIENDLCRSFDLAEKNIVTAAGVLEEKENISRETITDCRNRLQIITH